MFSRKKTDKLIYPLFLAALLMFVSYRPKYHLREDMPDDFFSPSTSDSPQKRAQQEKIASAYWESAQMNIQWKFTHGHPLPADVPAEFSIDARTLGPGASDPLARLLYWRRLEEVWSRPETWKKQYEWDWSWVHDPLTSASDWMRDNWNRWFAMHGPS
jgi:hypothetical protein